ncbi:MAG: hypothetical protein FVQ78_10580, partial [Solirubrobacterales bacterium]|nr:hypothetical protein [Solirubrobacterales bacterium]
MNKLRSILVILLLSLITLSFKAKAQSWDSVGTGLSGGFDIYEALAVDTVKNILYAGGNFTTAGGVSANCIAQWDGTSWDSLGSGMNPATDGVFAFTIFRDTLYAAGFFTAVGGVSANNIAKWDGTIWSSVGAGMNDFVYALAVYNDTLYAGGKFTTAGGVNVNYVAKWDGTSWDSVGAGMNNWVYSLAVYNGELYVGGFHDIRAIASWNGATWNYAASGLGEPFFGNSVEALSVYNGELYAGGIITEADGAPISPNIARWNGVSWDSVGVGVGPAFLDVTDALAVYNNELYLGGNFVTTGDGLLTVNGIARWDGAILDSVGAGMNGNVEALAVYNGELYALGSFTIAGGISANHIARWNAGTPPLCTSSFTSSATAICEGVTIDFTNTSTGAITYEWQENGTPFSTATDTSRTFGTAGTYTISLIADSGSCSDSSSTIITVNSTYDTTVSAAICQGDSIQLPGGAYADTSGIYYDTLTSVNGCDSVIATTLIVSPTYSINTPNDTICNGDSIMIFSIFRTTAGTYYDSLATVNSCDSVIATTLIVNPTYSFNTPNDTICDGDSVIIFSTVRKTAGTYYDTLPAINSCDSVIVTTLIVNPTYLINTPDDTICNGDSVLIGGFYRKIGGTYYDTLATLNSCDSIISTTLIVNPLPAITVSPSPGVVCNFGDTVMLAASGADSYLWSPAVGLNTTTGDTVLAFPPTDTVYTV